MIGQKMSREACPTPPGTGRKKIYYREAFLALKMEFCEHDAVHSLCISGGTHGNELNGVYLVKNWLKNGAHEIQRNSFRTHVVLTNLRATEQCVRFTDVDLNRQITPENLFSYEERKDCPYEIQRARELYSQFQDEAGQKAVDFWLDLHNTTANTGPFFITSHTRDPFPLHLASHLQIKFPEIRIMLLKPGNFENPHFDEAHAREEKQDQPLSKFTSGGIPNIGKEGFGFEMGPLANGILNASMFNLAKEIICGVLDTVEEFNNGKEFKEKEIEVFRILRNIHYPTDEDNSEISAMISPDLDGNDWKPLHPGNPLFLTFNGETIPFKGNNVVWPVFINEAAYFRNKIAMAITTKEKIVVPALKLKADQP